MNWSAEQVLALAPDPASAKSGKDLASGRKWVTLGHDGRAAWGECQGSGSKPYQTRIDLGEPAFNCSCPSRKFPCKHSLGLFLILLLGKPGTAKGWITEHLTAAISVDSTLLIQVTAGTSDESIRHGWNYARLLADGPSKAALVAGPMMRAMEDGKIARVEESNRILSEVQDTLITILFEKTLPIPELAVGIEAVRDDPGENGHGMKGPGALGGASVPVLAHAARVRSSIVDETKAKDHRKKPAHALVNFELSGGWPGYSIRARAKPAVTNKATPTAATTLRASRPTQQQAHPRDDSEGILAHTSGGASFVARPSRSRSLTPESLADSQGLMAFKRPAGPRSAGDSPEARTSTRRWCLTA